MHELTELQKQWDIPVIIPHDDAYTILSLYPSSSVVPHLTAQFASVNYIHALEPLMALIVDHSAEPDPYWATMVSVLMQSKAIPHLIECATRPLPKPEHSTFRLVKREKRDALIGIVRLFEQMSPADAGCVGIDVLVILQNLRDDTDQLASVQSLAGEALRVWFCKVFETSRIDLEASKP